MKTFLKEQVGSNQAVFHIAYGIGRCAVDSMEAAEWRLSL